MDIIISNSSGVPIYEQIEEQIKNQIMTGELSAGEILPSMRVLAKELKISIITTKRAYEDLERDGFIESVMGKGTFVKAINSDIVRENLMFSIEELLEEAVDKAITDLAEDSAIKPFIIKNKAEVKRMCITEYDEERAFSEQKEEGIEIGLERGILKTLAELVRDGILTITDAAKRAGITVSEFEAKTGMNE